jgi:hypothetical protein
MFKWYVIVLAALAMLLLFAGLLALILPEDYEGPEIYQIDKMHSIRRLDLLGGLLLIAGCGTAWFAGLLWQRRAHGS